MAGVDAQMERDELEGLEEAREVEITRSKLLRALSVANAGLELRLVHHKQGEWAYLLIGAPLMRLAREAERVGLPVQLKPNIHARLGRLSRADSADAVDDGGA
eukprot:884971-Prymnesium_polylepis.1